MAWFLFAGGMCVLFFATAQLLSKGKRPVHYLMATGCLDVVYAVLYAWAADTGNVSRVPVLADTDISALWLAIPSVYLAALTILHEGKKPVRRYWPYFVVPAVMAAGIVVYNAIEIAVVSGVSLDYRSHFSRPPLVVVRIVAMGGMAAAFVVLLVTAFRLRRAGKIAIERSFRHQVFFLAMYSTVAATVTAAVILRNDGFYRYALSFLCPVILAFALSRTDVRYFPREVPAAIPKPPSKPEWDRGSGELTARMETLMKTEAPYRRENLTLNRLARMLSVEPKRLTYHFHAHLATNFHGYVNSWRLKAVCRDLVHLPESSIIVIALRNGFNSKSSFNTLFSKTYGMTPSQYRKCRREDSGFEASSPRPIPRESGEPNPVPERDRNRDQR